MSPETIYGIRCSLKDEKSLVQQVNGYLATLQRTMAKEKNASLLGSRHPFVLKYFYWNLNKDAGTWFEIYPNEDTKGRWAEPLHKDCAWLLFVRVNSDTFPQAESGAEPFIKGLLSSITFDKPVLKTP